MKQNILKKIKAGAYFDLFCPKKGVCMARIIGKKGDSITACESTPEAAIAALEKEIKRVGRRL